MGHIGEIYGLITAFFWMITSLSFEVATRKFGALTVNFLRLALAFFFLSVFEYFVRGHAFPTDATLHNWIWLGLSAIIGFMLGDYMLFRSFAIVGARISQVFMSLAPAIAALFAWLILGEKMSPRQLLGMFITITGIILVVISRDNETKTGLKLNFPVTGILLALGGAMGQGIGLVISKFGMQGYDAFASSQIRVLTALAGFLVVFLVRGSWPGVRQIFHDKKASVALLIGSFFGPFLGVAFSLLAVQKTNPGVAQTLMSIVPIIIIPFSHFLFNEKIRFAEIIGAFIAFGGITLFFV